MGCTFLTCSVCNSDFLTSDAIVSNFDNLDDISIVCHRCEPNRNGEHWVKIDRTIVETWDSVEDVVSEGVQVERFEHDCIDCDGTFEDDDDVLINPRCESCDYARRKKSTEKMTRRKCRHNYFCSRFFIALF